MRKHWGESGTWFVLRGREDGVVGKQQHSGLVFSLTEESGPTRA